MAEQGRPLISIGDESQKHLVDYVKSAALLRDEGWNLRSRFESVDRSYQREADNTKEGDKARQAVASGNVYKLQNIQVPMVLESVENSVAFLSQVFLTEYPMFNFGAGPKSEDLALQWNTLIGEDQIQYGWIGQFNIAFRNGEKYNFAPMEIDWKKEVRYKVGNGTGNRGTALEEVLWEGNCIKSLDPYNTIYDARVPLYKLHEEGEFAGYVEQMTRIQVKRMLANLGPTRLKNDKAALESNINEIEYYIPQINKDVVARGHKYSDGSFNWIRWAFGDAQEHIKYSNMYTVTKLYARIMPYEFGIRAPRDQTPDVWKLVLVNNVLVFAEPLPNAHEYLPIIIVQPWVDNLDHQTKSSAENQQPFQEMVSALWNAKLSSARRRISDRMLYNPLLVDPDHINSPNPAAKIPIRPTAYGRKLEEAIYPIPFNDDNAQYFIQEATGIAEWGMRANGQNRVSVGQFQKGNKLESEFQTVMANAGARERTKAIMWETFGMHPIKTIMKNNYLQFTPQGVRYNRYLKQEVEIDPVKLRQAALEFQIGDGLLPIEKLVSADDLTQAFQTMGAVPAIAQEYKAGELFAHLMKLRGAKDLNQFRKDPATMQYEQALSAWQNTMAMMMKTNMTPEQMQQMMDHMNKTMPKPPSQQPQVQGAQSGTTAT